MGNCIHHQHKKSFSWLPTTLTHNHDDHDCGCVKCYLSSIVSTTKIEFVWIIEYILLFTVFNSESNLFKNFILLNFTRPRSPPEFI